MTSTIDRQPQDDDPPVDVLPQPPASGRSWQGVRALLVRMHFYAGVFVAPFVFIAALTGLLYSVTPQLDRLVYGDTMTVTQVGETPRPLAEQIAAARAEYPEGALASVITPSGPQDATRVVLSLPELGDRQQTVFVDPYTAQVKGELTTWFGSTPLTTGWTTCIATSTSERPAACTRSWRPAGSGWSSPADSFSG